MIVLDDLEIEMKLEILSVAAKYDVACTSSGVERKGNREGMGNAQGVYVGFGSNQIRSSVSRHYAQIPVFSGSIFGVHGISRYLGFEI